MSIIILKAYAPIRMSISMNSGCIQQEKRCSSASYRDNILHLFSSISMSIFILVIDNFRHFKTSFLAVKIDKGEHL